MSANFKWNKSNDEIKSDEKDLRVVLFTSRNEDNQNIENFKERKIAFLAWFNGYNTPEWVMKKFLNFTREGQKDETSRMYISVNKRNPQKIKKELAMYLIDDVLGDRHIEVTHIESFTAGVAAKTENREESKWLFDFDSFDGIEEFTKDIYEMSGLLPNLHLTKNGYAVLVDRGFDTRELLKKWPDVGLKKDDLLLVHWAVNCSNKKEEVNE